MNIFKTKYFYKFSRNPLSVIGLVIIKNLEYLENNKWANGNIYDARSGKTYSLNANLEDKNTLFMRGYLGFSFIGKTTTWTRIK